MIRSQSVTRRSRSCLARRWNKLSKIIDRARALRPVIEIAAQSLSDEQAVYAPELFETWDPNGKHYAVDHKVRFEGVVYRVIQEHTSQPEWRPDAASSLFARVLIPDPSIIPEWEQPDSTNAYMKHDIVRHNGITWESMVDFNVWEPGCAGTEALWRVIDAEVNEGEPLEGSGGETESKPEEGQGTNNEPETEQSGDQEAPEEPSEDPANEWEQPTGAADAYHIGDIVIYNGVRYVCTYDNNVYAPGVFGWETQE